MWAVHAETYFMQYSVFGLLCCDQLLSDKGVQFHFKTTASEFVGEGGKLKRVVLKDGTVLPADLCVAGIGNLICVLSVV